MEYESSAHYPKVQVMVAGALQEFVFFLLCLKGVPGLESHCMAVRCCDFCNSEADFTA